MDHLLDQQLVVVFESLVDSHGQLILAVHFRHSDTGARVAGFHKARIAAHLPYGLEINGVAFEKMEGRRNRHT